MRALVRVFLTLPIKSVWDKKTSSGKVVHICTRKFHRKFEIIKMKNTGVMDYYKKSSVVASRIGHRASCESARMTRRGDESDVMFCFSFSTRHAITERIFLIIHNFRIFHLNNLKFLVKLLCTYMKNFPTGSLLSVKLTQTLFIGKVRKTRTMARINLLLNIYEQSTI